MQFADQVTENNAIRNLQNIDLFSFRELAQKRRSIKYFDSHAQLPDYILRQIIDTATYAPSAFNLQHWNVIHIKSDEVRQRVAASSFHQPQIYHAAAVLAVVMNKLAWKQDYPINQSTVDPDSRTREQQRLSTLYADNPTLFRDEAMRSCSMFSMLLMLGSEAAGYRSCPMTGCDFDAIHNILNLSEHQELCMLVTIGKESKENILRTRRRMPVESLLSLV